MSPVILLFLSCFFIKSMSSKVDLPKTSAHISVMGLVYCDICSNNSFSRHSYFLPGAEVRIDCKFKAISPKTREQISFSVNRTTNKYGVYKLEIPAVDGIACAEASIASACQATLMWSSAKSCNVPGYRTTSDEMTFVNSNVLKVPEESLKTRDFFILVGYIRKSLLLVLQISVSM